MAQPVEFSSHPGHGSAGQSAREHVVLSDDGMNVGPYDDKHNNFGLKTAPGELGKQGYVVRG